MNTRATRRPATAGPLARALRRLRGDGPLGLGLTLLGLPLLLWFGYQVLRWGVLEAVWIADHPDRCRAAAGACWAVIAEKYRIILFAAYPYEEQWRAGLASAILLALLGASAVPRFWGRILAWAWAAGVLASLALQAGGVLGLASVPTAKWGGLPVTLLLFVGTIALGMPLAVAMALGRRSRILAVRVLATVYIETIRGIPLVNVLFVASLMLPLFLPAGWRVNELVRAQAALVVFFGAYAAEVVRAGLASLPRSQAEAANSLGVGAWDRIMRIELPQALRQAMPALANDFIRTFKNTSLLAVIGILDVVGSANVAVQDPLWSRFYGEVYLAIAAIYFVVCFGLSAVGARLERRLASAN